MERVADRTSRTGQQSQLGSPEGAGQRGAFSRTQINENHKGLTCRNFPGRSTHNKSPYFIFYLTQPGTGCGMIGLTSIDPQRTEGIRAAMASASFWSLASMR